MSQSKAITFGQSNYLLFTTADAEGRVKYEPCAGTNRKFRVGPHLAGRRLAVIDSFRGAWLLDEYARRLHALTLHYLDEPATVLFGSDWGEWLDIVGARHKTPPPQRLLSQAGSSLMYDPGARILRGEFVIEPQFRECFSEDTKISFHTGSSRIEHGIEIEFSVPSGEFAHSRIHLLDKKGSGGAKSFGIKGFPFIFPGRRDPNAPVAAERPARPSLAENYSLSGFNAAREAAAEESDEAEGGGDSGADSGRAKLRRRSVPPPAASPAVPEAIPPRAAPSATSPGNAGADQPARAKLKLRRPSSETTSHAPAAKEAPAADSADAAPASPPRAKLKLRKK